MGANSNDNGFLRFKYYKVPRISMMTRFARVNRNGEYKLIDPNAMKILYSSIVKTRALIIKDSWFNLAKALTIAIRYSILRNQFPDPKTPENELKIIDYQI